MIPLTYIRSSSYGSHSMCEMKYFGEYILGWTGLSNKKADCGTIVHKTMEILANINLARLENKQEIEDDCIGIVDCISPDPFWILDNVYSYYSNINSHHIWTPIDYKNCKKWTNIILEHNDGQFNPLNQNIVKAEQHFDITLNYDWAKYKYDVGGETIEGNLQLKGTIDLITKAGDGIHEIVDYKTGQRKNWKTDQPKEYEDFLKDFQLRLYHYAHMVLYPHISNVLLTIFYIRDGGPYTICFGRDDIDETLNMIKEKFEYIRDTNVPKTEYGGACRFCPLATTTFEGTSVKPLEKNRNSTFKYNKSDCMSKCDQIKYSLEHRDISLVMEHMSKEGHSVNKYKAPGEV